MIFLYPLNDLLSDPLNRKNEKKKIYKLHLFFIKTKDTKNGKRNSNLRLSLERIEFKLKKEKKVFKNANFPLKESIQQI